MKKQGEQKPIINVPPREVILAIWDLGNEWKELTNGSISTEYGTQLDYIQKHWQESEYYLREKQGEQKVNYTTLVETGNGGINALVTRELSTNGCNDDQKPTDKVEPKFKVGDWVVNKGHSYLIADIDFLDNRYLFEIGGYTHEQLNWEYIENVDKKYHLWTIADTKEGDVLSDGTTIFILKDLLSDGSVMSYCDYDTDSGESDAFCPLSVNLICSKITPATKAQRDLLFQKMKESGYEWDAEKKELKRIEPTETAKWSAQEEYCICELEAMVREAWGKAENVRNDITIKKMQELMFFLKTLKPNPQSKQEWSEDDETNLTNTIIMLKEGAIHNFTYLSIVPCVNWLKSLKQRIGG